MSVVLVLVCSACKPSPPSGLSIDHAVFANGSRTLPSTIWRPKGKGPYPLVVFGHGRGSSPGAYSDLLTTWAQAGFEVAAPKSPNQDYDLVALDLRAVIRGMIGRPEVDRDHVAVAGQSLGAIHAMAVARNTCCRDEHVRAALIFAGVAREFSGGTWQSTAPPTLFMHGDKDTTVRYEDGRSAYRFWPAPKWFVTLRGASHTSPFGNPVAGVTDRLVARTTTDFLRWQLRDDRAAGDEFHAALRRSEAATLEEEPKR